MNSPPLNTYSETLAEYYIRTYSHLIPNDVELWEYDESTMAAVRLAVNERMPSDAAKPHRYVARTKRSTGIPT
jgi:hypothetical protein